MEGSGRAKDKVRGAPARREVVTSEGGDEWGKSAWEVSINEGVGCGGGEHGAAEGSMGCGQGGGGVEEVGMGKRWGVSIGRGWRDDAAEEVSNRRGVEAAV